ncbi:uncharacterized protein A4U43_C07F38780 [Asparagus officinalis]|uniref:EXPERA domain-containing protein n=1 Tax=Asparagus officinalis TaxID=4686 RepID=A0A5P1EIN7_ASPOF|nr:transmembrane protein 97-like isoform X1 [Asparagus officinalis]ONK65603.1 uncharacterized protein A4U43_C07F38780 [Asparagus officinalis]
MGLISILVDGFILLFSVLLSLAFPLMDSQTIAPSYLHPSFLVEFKQQYERDYGDYLMKEMPPFFVGLVWVEALFLWPLALLNAYGILSRKKWVRTTLIMAGVGSGVSMASIMSELLGSGRESKKLVQMYSPFVVFAILATLRGLFPPRYCSISASNAPPPAQKKRV